MLNAALNFKDDNLLAGAMYFPKRMIWRFAEFNEGRVKQMFIDLFDENNDVTDYLLIRITHTHSLSTNTFASSMQSSQYRCPSISHAMSLVIGSPQL